MTQGQHPDNSDSQRGSLGTKKERAIVALLQHGNKEKAAKEAGVHPATLWRWLKQPKFQEALREARREAFSQCNLRLQQSGPAAVMTLLRVMADQQAPTGSKVRAAQCVLESSRKNFEVEDLEVRIARLERSAQNIETPAQNLRSKSDKRDQS